eukprot:907833-Rhodomonas_salina.3
MGTVADELPQFLVTVRPCPTLALAVRAALPGSWALVLTVRARAAWQEHEELPLKEVRAALVAVAGVWSGRRVTDAGSVWQEALE